MDPAHLYEQPFTYYSPAGLDGVFPDADAAKIIHILSAINSNAAAQTWKVTIR